jgi:hypothetical protein
MRVVKIITGIVTIIFLFSIGALITSKFLLKTDYWKCKDGQWVQIGNPSEPMPSKECLVDEKKGFFGNDSEENDDDADSDWPGTYVVGIEFSDDLSPLAFRFPLSCQDLYEEEIIEEESGIRRAKINYLGENDKAMLFMINIFPKSMNIYEIENMPNNEMLGQNVNYYYTFSQALDMPFKEGSNDYEVYSKMMGEVDEIISLIMLSGDYEAHDIKVNENNSEENFIIDISYPRIVGAEFENTFGVLMDEYINEAIAGFKDKVSTAEFNEEMEEKLSILKLNYNFESADIENGVVGVNIYGFEEINGNEARNILSKTFRYDLKNDKELDI